MECRVLALDLRLGLVGAISVVSHKKCLEHLKSVRISVTEKMVEVSSTDGHVLFRSVMAVEGGPPSEVQSQFDVNSTKVVLGMLRRLPKDEHVILDKGSGAYWTVGCSLGLLHLALTEGSKIDYKPVLSESYKVGRAIPEGMAISTQYMAIVGSFFKSTKDVAILLAVGEKTLCVRMTSREVPGHEFYVMMMRDS